MWCGECVGNGFFNINNYLFVDRIHIRRFQPTLGNHSVAEYLQTVLVFTR